MSTQESSWLEVDLTVLLGASFHQKGDFQTKYTFENACAPEGTYKLRDPTAGSANIIFHLPADSLIRSSGRRSNSTNKPTHAPGTKLRRPSADSSSLSTPFSGCVPAGHE